MLEMIYVKYLALVVFVVASISITSACMCFPRPAHLSYCEANNVVKLKVMQKRCYFEYQPKGVPRSIKLTSANQYDLHHDVTGEYSEIVDNLVWLPNRTAILQREVTKHNRTYKSLRCDKYRYRVRILKVFKGQYKEHARMLYYESGWTDCGSNLRLKQTYYVMAKNIIGGIGPCEWRSADSPEVSAMFNNETMENFARGCEECTFCRDTYPKPTCPNNSSCPIRKVPDNKRAELEYSCRLNNATGVCEWNQAGN